MGEEAALAHAELLGERADGEAFEALRGGDVNGAGEDGFAGADAFGLFVKEALASRLLGAGFGGLGDRFSAGRRAQSGGHYDTVTQATN